GPRLKVPELAQAVGISQAQLARLFVAEHGMPPLQFIRTAQAQRAHRLLTGTVEPIKAIAAACGFPDLHTFNRFTRARLGASPREIRAGQGVVDTFRVETYRLQDRT
ncbi:AraC family transcriptional regulator, partial [bacterium]